MLLTIGAPELSTLTACAVAIGTWLPTSSVAVPLLSTISSGDETTSTW